MLRRIANCGSEWAVRRRRGMPFIAAGGASHGSIWIKALAGSIWLDQGGLAGSKPVAIPPGRGHASRIALSGAGMTSAEGVKASSTVRLVFAYAGVFAVAGVLSVVPRALPKEGAVVFGSEI